jgi:hypothetical protein
LNRHQQARVAGDVIHHQRDHFEAKRLAHPLGANAQTGAHRFDGLIAINHWQSIGALALLQALHYGVDLLHFFECFERGWNRGIKIGRCFSNGPIKVFELLCELPGKLFLGTHGQDIFKFARQQTPQPVQGQQGVIEAVAARCDRAVRQTLHSDG